MKTITILLLLSSVLTIYSPLKNDKPCPGGNRFLFLSNFALGKQGDLTNTTRNISETKIGRVEYQDELYRTYKIENITHTMNYQ